MRILATGGGGGKKLAGVVGANDVTVASGVIWWCEFRFDRAKLDDETECVPMLPALPLDGW